MYCESVKKRSMKLKANAEMKPCNSNGSSMRILRSNSVIKEREIECGDQANSSEGASFIKLLNGDFSKQMQVPQEFTVMFNGYVPRRFIIESAITKKCWRVEVEREVGAVYFTEGWSDFVEAHHLELGNYLLFEYKEQSIFLVKIYDKNGCQKMVRGAQGGKHNPVKIIDFGGQEERDELEPRKLERSRPRQETTKRYSTGEYGNGIYKKQHTTPKEKVTASVSFNENNVVYSVKIQNNNRQLREMYIPKTVALATKFLNGNEVMFEDYMGTRWPVKLLHLRDGRKALTIGLNNFMKDNEVAAGDSLSLEFVSDGLIKIQVTKGSEVVEEFNGAIMVPNMDCELIDLDSCTADVDPVSASVKTKRVSPEPTSSSFSFLWGPSTNGSFLIVPKIVTEGQNLMNTNSIVLRGPDGKCWPVNVNTRRDGRVALANGWGYFWKGHAIKAGDSLDFEFVSEYIVQVNINRGKLLNFPTKSEDNAVNLSPTNNDEPPTECTDPEMVMTQAQLVVAPLEPVAVFPISNGFSEDDIISLSPTNNNEPPIECPDPEMVMI